MKKIFLSLAVLVGLSLTGCKGDYDDWTLPQHNDAEPTAATLMTVEVQAPSQTIQLEDVTDSLVQVFVPVKVESSVDCKYYVTLSDGEGNSKKVLTDAKGNISKDELTAVINDFFGKKQLERSLNALVTAEYVTNGTTIVASAPAYVLKVLPAVPDMNYWIYGKQNNRDSKEKTLPLMPVTKQTQTVTTYFSGKIDTKMWSDDNFGDSKTAYGATGGNKSLDTWDFSYGGGYICSPTAGWYTLSFDFSTYKYTFTKIENQQPTDYSSISLIGQFNDWSGDTDLTPVATSNNAWNSHCWYVKSITLPTGELKIRANHDWATSWGVSKQVKETTYGVGNTTDGSPNISVQAGTYSVYFNDITGEFLFIAE